MWFGVTKDWDDFDIDWLADPRLPAGAAQSVTVLYDSKCGVCRWEVDNLGSLDASSRHVTFADIEDESFDPSAAGNGGVSYEAAMRSFTVVRDDGEVLEGRRPSPPRTRRSASAGSLASRACRWSVRSRRRGTRSLPGFVPT